MPTSTVASAPTVVPSNTSTRDRDVSVSSSASVSSRLSMLSRIQQRPHQAYKKVGPYTLGPTIGQGEFGKVKLGWSEGEGGVKRQFAFKLLREDKMRGIDVSQKVKLQHEIYALQSCNHPNIIRLERVVRFEKYIAIILDYASGGDMFTYIYNNGRLEERNAQRLFAQLVSGVEYMHAKGFAHRDLKLENLLLDSNNNIQISDFGFANRFRNSSGISLMKTACGSPCYAAPEVVNSYKNYDGRRADAWSVGVILFTFLAGYLPFDDDPTNPDSDDVQKLYRYIANTPLKFPEWIGVEARDLLRQILVVNPDKRMKLQDVKSHRWLSDHFAFLSITPNEHEGTAPWQSSGMRPVSASQSHSAIASQSSHSSRPAFGHGRSASTATAMSGIPTSASTPGPNRASAGHYRQQQALRQAHQQYQQSHTRSASTASTASTASAAAAAALALPSSRSSQAIRKDVSSRIPVKDPRDQRRQSAHPAMMARPRQDEVSDLGISNPNPQRLQQTAKPRPVSYQVKPLSSLSSPNDGLYSPSSSQPRVALNRESSKSGEISRPYHESREAPSYSFSMQHRPSPSRHHRGHSAQLFPGTEVPRNERSEPKSYQPPKFDVESHQDPAIHKFIAEMTSESPQKKVPHPPIRCASTREQPSEGSETSKPLKPSPITVPSPTDSIPTSMLPDSPAAPNSAGSNTSNTSHAYTEPKKTDIPMSRSRFRLSNSLFARKPSHTGTDTDTRRVSMSSVASSVAPSVAPSVAMPTNTQRRQSGIPVKAPEKEPTNFRQKTLNFFKRRSMVG